MAQIDEAFIGFKDVMGLWLGSIDDMFTKIYKQDADYTPGGQQINRWLNTIWEKNPISEGIGGEKRWVWTVIVEAFYKSGQDVDTDYKILADQWFELVEKGLENRENFDLFLQQGGWKFMYALSSKPYPFERLTPGRFKKIITFKCYMLNRWP